MAVSAALLWLFWLGCGSAGDPTSPSVSGNLEAPNTFHSRQDGQKFVWRGDARDDNTIRRAGGFRPRGNYVNDTEAYDLERHKQGAVAWKDDQYNSGESSAESCSPSEMGWASAYVSTAHSSSAVSRFPWIYLIRGTPNMIDTVRALDADDNEMEFAALGGILWSQVVGHMPLETLNSLHGEYPYGIPDDVAVANVVPNPQYDTERFRDSVADSSMAEGYSRGSMQAAIEFMNRPNVGQVVGWTGQFPLLPIDSPCLSPSASSEETSSEETQGANSSPQQPGQQVSGSGLTDSEILDIAAFLREVDGSGPLFPEDVDPREGEAATNIDIKATFGSSTVAVDHLIQVQIRQVHDSFMGGVWFLQGFKLKGRCAGSLTEIQLDKFQSVNQAAQTPKWVEKNYEWPAWKSTIDAKKDWRLLVDCPRFNHLQVDFSLSNSFWAGTWDDLYIGFRKEDTNKRDTKIAEKPHRGTEYSKTINLTEVFESESVLVRDIKSFHLYSNTHLGQLDSKPQEYWGPSLGPALRPSQENVPDEWKMKGITLKGTCAGSSTEAGVTKYQNVDEWFKRGGAAPDFKQNIHIGDWHWVDKVSGKQTDDKSEF
ncbi:heat-labile enterotoxin alpha chain domain-containing protein [Hirsutella rhossiliensis]